MFVGVLVILDLASEVCYTATPVSKYSETKEETCLYVIKWNSF